MSLDTAIARAVAEEVAKILTDRLPTGSPDDLIRLPGPLEALTATRLVRAQLLPAKKIGRHWYTLRRHLAALVDEPAPTPGFDPARALALHVQGRR